MISVSRLSLFFLELTVIQIRIEALPCQQLFMISLLNDISVLHHQDQICILNGRKSVGDNKAGSALHQVIHSLLDLHFCSCINGRCGLIQDQYLIICQDRSCNGKQLLLPLRNITGLLIQDHLIAAGLLHDKVVDMGRFAAAITSSSVASSLP